MLPEIVKRLEKNFYKVLRIFISKNIQTKSQVREVEIMETKDDIIEMYYTNHLKQVDIAKFLSVSKQYVSEVIKADSRYKEEKEFRKRLNAEKRIQYLQDYFKTYCRKKKEDITKEELEAIHNQDVMELSYYPEMSDEQFARNNLSIYHTNKVGNLVVDSKIIVPSDVPKTINRNRKVPTQKYKYCFSY